jgi:integrase
MAIYAECPTCRKKQSNRNKKCKCGENLVKAKRSERVNYWISYYLPNGKNRRELISKKLSDAQAAEGKRKAQKYENPAVLEKVADNKTTFKQLTGWYTELENVKLKAYYPTLKINLASFNNIFADTLTGNIKPADLENYQAKRKTEGKSDSYIDQEIGAARTMINKAFDNDMVGIQSLKAFKKIKKLLKKNSNARDRILTPEEFKELMTHLPFHTRQIFAAGFYTGMRKGEILNLTWDKVDLKNRCINLSAEDTKDGEPRRIPISHVFLKQLTETPRAIHDNHVFLFRGKPVQDVRNGIRNACDKAGITYGRFKKNGFVFHDLRHTFNTYMRKAGVPESVIMVITGHSTREMFDRYNTVDLEDALHAVEKMGSFLQNSDQNSDQNNQKQKKGSQ